MPFKRKTHIVWLLRWLLGYLVTWVSQDLLWDIRNSATLIILCYSTQLTIFYLRVIDNLLVCCNIGETIPFLHNRSSLQQDKLSDRATAKNNPWISWNFNKAVTLSALWDHITENQQNINSVTTNVRQKRVRQIERYIITHKDR